MKLAPLADKVTADLLKHGYDINTPMIEEVVLDTIHFETGGNLDWEPTDIAVGMVTARLHKANRETKWAGYLVTTAKGLVVRSHLGEVYAKNAPAALLVAFKRWPDKTDATQPQGGFSVREA